MSSVEDRVTGRTTFLADMPVEGMLHATMVRIPSPRAAFTVNDVSEALSVPGVLAVLTADDLMIDGSIPRFGPQVMDQPMLAIGATRYEGEPVAVVLAETERGSRIAAGRVDVSFTEREPVMSRDAALAAAPLHAERPDSQAEWVDSNIMGSWTFEHGDLVTSERDAAVVIEGTYRIPFAHHFAMEVPAVLAMPEGDGLTVWSPVQHPFLLRRVLSSALDLPMSLVRVIGTELGGSFGSKGYPKMEPLAAALSLKMGRPVRIRITAEEAFLLAQRESAHIRMRTGVAADGRVVFHEMDADFLVGAYTDISARVVAKTGLHAVTPYRADAVRVTARGLFTTTPPTTAFRGFGAPHAVFALESQMDIAANRLGMDPVEFRLLNLLPKDHPIPGEKPVDGDWAQLLRETASAMEWAEPKRKGRGRGIALGLKSCIPGTTSIARVVVSADGSVALYVGTTEMGQGTHATLGRLAADRLGVNPDYVAVVAADTSVVPFDALTASSRSLVHMGNAVVAACDDIIEQLGEITSTWGDGGEVESNGDRSIALMIEDRFGPGMGELTGIGSFSGSKDPSHVLAGPTPFYEVVATAVELEIDRGTGALIIHRIVHGTDAGKVLNPRRAAGLDEGGVIMGLGLATSEELMLDPSTGRLLNGSSLDYRIPTVLDAPHMESLFVENGDGPGPHGSKGLAEGGVMAIGPAIAAAVHDCTGIRFTELPITPERVLLALRTTSS